eukprot:PhF_6_TR31203/c0_g1_i1/m.45757
MTAQALTFFSSSGPDELSLWCRHCKQHYTSHMDSDFPREHPEAWSAKTCPAPLPVFWTKRKICIVITIAIITIIGGVYIHYLSTYNADSNAPNAATTIMNLTLVFPGSIEDYNKEERLEAVRGNISLALGISQDQIVVQVIGAGSVILQVSIVIQHPQNSSTVLESLRSDNALVNDMGMLSVNITPTTSSPLQTASLQTPTTPSPTTTPDSYTIPPTTWNTSRPSAIPTPTTGSNAGTCQHLRFPPRAQRQSPRLQLLHLQLLHLQLLHLQLLHLQLLHLQLLHLQ